MNKVKVLSLFVAFCLLTGLTFTPMVSAAPSSSKKAAFNTELKAVAKKTYAYFTDYTDTVTGLTYDEVRTTEKGTEEAKRTSPTNISMYMMSTVSAQQLGIISKKEAVTRLQTTLNSLENMDKWNGLFYNWYNTEDGSLKKDWGQFISQVDNGWMSAGLIVVGQAYQELHEQTNQLVKAMNYTTLYDPEVGQFRGGYDVAKGELTEHHYGSFYTEPRVASYIAIGKGDVPKEHWWKMYRTMPAEFDWQSQVPQGKTVKYDGVKVFEGSYVYKNKKFVPSWGGSMFEALMPGMVIKEKELGTRALGLNNKRHVQLQIQYAKDKGYAAWGFSPAATPTGYSEFAATPLGISGYKDSTTVTAHATFLALEYAPEAAKKNIKALQKLKMAGKYGFYDSVNVKTGELAKAYLALDQGMIMISIANYLQDGVIRDYFHSDPIGKKPESLLKKEVFSIQ
ncbi:glucoamylase family protein [Paenibacillus sp. KACC 21273]|uniref:glucoamylase family protein n=1 Tax=Paenibacillus sp. KACC 21273 TaxID=3025665 RepID=UPI0023655F49|nr:glucoamylase family protein [Paenibacillus sp. KACC 21273]WDF48831.1 glucoamylase family protein [Paenibacillus sp. KACC 21273]